MWPMSTRREGGFTLTELSVSMGVFLIFLAFATPFMFGQLRQALETERQVDLQQTARSALRTMVRELRQASELYASSEKPSGKTTLSFGVDLNGDGVIASYTDNTKALEQISYYLSAGTLFRGRQHGQGVPLANDVEAVEFTLFGSNLTFDANGDGVVSETELDRNANGLWDGSELTFATRVQIELTVAEADEAQTYAAEAFLRNQVTG